MFTTSLASSGNLVAFVEKHTLAFCDQPGYVITIDCAQSNGSFNSSRNQATKLQRLICYMIMNHIVISFPAGTRPTKLNRPGNGATRSPIRFKWQNY